MARNKVTLKFDGYTELTAKLDKIGKSPLLIQGIESALKQSKKCVNSQLKKVSTKAKYPAKGTYSTGLTADSIDKDFTVEWEGNKAYIKVGYDFSKSGLRTIMLMYGTPRMKPAKGMKTAIYGTKTAKELAVVQKEALEKVLERYINGN